MASDWLAAELPPNQKPYLKLINQSWFLQAIFLWEGWKGHILIDSQNMKGGMLVEIYDYLVCLISYMLCYTQSAHDIMQS